MKTWIFGLGILLAGCQAKVTNQQAGKNAALAALISFPVPDKLPEIDQFAAQDTLTAPMRNWLQQHDLAACWQARPHADIGTVMEGFLGDDHDRFAMIFNKVVRDEKRSELYYVRGKTRSRKTLTTFTGILLVRQVIDLPGSDAPLKGNRHRFSPPDKYAFTARAQLYLLEGNPPTQGEYHAEALVDFVLPHNNRAPEFPGNFDSNGFMPTRGGEVLVRGSHRSATGAQRDFVVSPLVFAAAPDVFKDFEIGDRGGEINPKYAKDWADYWKNDEWWHDSPKPKLSL